MFPEGSIIICGVQLNCKGETADGEVTLEDGVIIPCCNQCGLLLDTDQEGV